MYLCKYLSTTYLLPKYLHYLSAYLDLYIIDPIEVSKEVSKYYHLPAVFTHEVDFTEDRKTDSLIGT